MYIDNLPTFRLSDLPRALLQKRYAYDFNLLRSGLDFLLKHSRLSEIKKRRILVPAFICPTVPEVVKQNGFSVKFADCDMETFNLKIMPDDLDDVGAILLCHTFGARKMLPKIKNGKVLIIEDCAHFLTKELEGDYGLYSMYKQLPNLRGGFVVAKNEDLLSAYGSIKQEKFSFGDFRDYIIRLRGAERGILNFLRARKGLPISDFDDEERIDVAKAPKIISGFYEVVKSRFDPDKNSRIYYQLKEQFLKKGFCEYFYMQEMPEGSVPCNFSIRLRRDDFFARDMILLNLRRAGVFADRLWYNAETHGRPHASILTRTVINLPLHPQVLNKLANVI